VGQEVGVLRDAETGAGPEIPAQALFGRLLQLAAARASHEIARLSSFSSQYNIIVHIWAWFRLNDQVKKARDYLHDVVIPEFAQKLRSTAFTDIFFPSPYHPSFFFDLK
jgi:hypothetical protein